MVLKQSKVFAILLMALVVLPLAAQAQPRNSGPHQPLANA
jgi:hypothetical protein